MFLAAAIYTTPAELTEKKRGGDERACMYPPDVLNGKDEGTWLSSVCVRRGWIEGGGVCLLLGSRYAILARP